MEVLAIGDRSFLQFLIPALAESENVSYSTIILDGNSPSPAEGSSWNEVIRPYVLILYARETNDLRRYRELYHCCLEQNKCLLPAVFTQGFGALGPLTTDRADACWESAWRRLHVPEALSDRPAEGAYRMLSGWIVDIAERYAESFEAPLRNSVYLLRGDTLEGELHRFQPHPLVVEPPPVPVWVPVELSILQEEHNKPGEETTLARFECLVSPRTGILRSLEEGGYPQLPVSICSVRPSDPLSAGPDNSLPAIVCVGADHEEARREAGCSGLEAYASRWAQRVCRPVDSEQGPLLFTGAGETAAEAIGRGLQAFLQHNLESGRSEHTVAPVDPRHVMDPRCRYYLRALEAISPEPFDLACSKDRFGFPVLWVRIGEQWHSAVDGTPTFALRRVLSKVLLQLQAELKPPAGPLRPSVTWPGRFAPCLVFPEESAAYEPETVERSIRMIRQTHSMSIADLAFEPAMKEFRVFGLTVAGGLSHGH